MQDDFMPGAVTLDRGRGDRPVVLLKGQRQKAAGNMSSGPPGSKLLAFGIVPSAPAFAGLH